MPKRNIVFWLLTLLLVGGGVESLGILYEKGESILKRKVQEDD